ncbi:hypothetical protein QQ045_030802 [Rhodiola kirilowii]
MCDRLGLVTTIKLDGDGQTMEVGNVQAGDLLRRFCSKLGMSNQEIKAAHEAVQKAEELHIRKNSAMEL